MNDPVRPSRWEKAVRDYQDRKKGRTSAVKGALLEKAFALRAREDERVEAVILRDQRDRQQDLRRVTARVEFDQGRFVNLADTRDTLPDEQLAAGEFEEVTVFLPAETIRENVTIRRVSRAYSLYQRGVLDNDTFPACVWYRDCFDFSGLDPLIASTFEPKYGTGERDFSHLARTESQADARESFRFAREFVPLDVRPLFELVILSDMAIADAAKLTRCRYANASAAFKRGALGLLEYVGPLLEITKKLELAFGLDAGSEI